VVVEANAVLDPAMTSAATAAAETSFFMESAFRFFDRMLSRGNFIPGKLRALGESVEFTMRIRSARPE
jgi:hypothetical protein